MESNVRTLAPMRDTSTDVEAPIAEAPASKLIYRFTEKNTIGEMLVAATTLESLGQKPRLRFVRSYLEVPEVVELFVEEDARATEMAVTE